MLTNYYFVSNNFGSQIAQRPLVVQRKKIRKTCLKTAGKSKKHKSAFIIIISLKMYDEI